MALNLSPRQSVLSVSYSLVPLFPGVLVLFIDVDNCWFLVFATENKPILSLWLVESQINKKNTSVCRGISKIHSTLLLQKSVKTDPGGISYNLLSKQTTEE